MPLPMRSVVTSWTFRPACAETVAKLALALGTPRVVLPTMLLGPRTELKVWAELATNGLPASSWSSELIRLLLPLKESEVSFPNPELGLKTTESGPLLMVQFELLILLIVTCPLQTCAARATKTEEIAKKVRDVQAPLKMRAGRGSDPFDLSSSITTNEHVQRNAVSALDCAGKCACGRRTNRRPRAGTLGRLRSDFNCCTQVPTTKQKQGDYLP